MISDVAIRRPVFTWMLMFSLIVFGWIAFRSMGVSQMPDVDFPVVNVSATYEGAAPEVMESDVVDILETAVTGVQGITGINSSIRSGSANISIDFDLSKDIDIAVQEVQNKISEAMRQLPDDMEPPVVRKVNPEDQPIMWLSVLTEKMSPPELMAFVRDRLRDPFLTVSGVADVFLGGYVDPNLRVWVSSNKLRQYQLSVDDVINTIQQEHNELPSGRIEMPEREMNVRTLGEAANPSEFGRLVINRRGGAPNFTPIYLGQVARIEEGLADIRRKSRVLGKPAVGIGIRKQRGANAVEVAQSVKKKLAVVQASLPEGVEMGINFDSTRFIEEAIHELNFTLVLSAILTALVCWLFLGSFSATLNVVLAIPTSLVGSFIILKALGFTLNTFTVLGLSLAIGIVVDDAIMVLENIVRHRERGEGKVEAAHKGAREIAFAALAATAAIIAIFLPVAYMKGIIGRFFFQFGVTISVAVALSLLEALTLTPMRCAQFLNVEERTTWLGKAVERAFHRAAAAYRSWLEPVLRHPWKVVGASLVFFAATFMVVKLLPKEFVPPQDQGSLMVRLKAAEGSSLAYTDKKVREIEAILSKRPEIQRYFVSIGGFGGGEVNTAMTFVTLKPLADRGIMPGRKRPMTQQEFAQVLREEFGKVKGIRAFVQDPSLQGFSSRRGFPVEFAIRGPEWDTLVESSKKVMDLIQKTGTVVDVDSDFVGGADEIQVIPDRAKARLRGVSVTDVGRVINAMVGGVVAGRYSKGGKRFDIRVKMEESESKTSADIKDLYVRNNRGELISLSEVVQIRERPGPQVISRQERERAISVFANVAPGSSQAQALEVTQRVAREALPPGYRIVPSGSAQTFQESFQSLIFALVLGLLVSYMVLASQFNSFIHPVTVLVALPFSFSGAFVALWAGGQSLNIYSMIGLVLLMGIVKKNSILLVDFTNQVKDTGKGTRESLLEACPVRLRPILMTSIATVAGAIPPALAIGPGAESRIPMALAIIGGVLVSTALTLFVVPCVYELFDRLKRSKA